MKELLDLKKDMKKRKPAFTAQDSHKKDRIKARWRKPRGSDSKMKHQFRGYGKIVKRGYMTPLEAKHVNPLTGLRAIVVSNSEDIDKINIKEEGILLSKTLGKRKKIELIKYATEKKVTILNVKDTEKFLKDVEAELQKKKSDKDKKLAEKKKKEDAKKKEAKKTEDKKKSSKKENLDEKVSSDAKKDEEKKEKDKLLISTE